MSLKLKSFFSPCISKRDALFLDQINWTFSYFMDKKDWTCFSSRRNTKI